MHIAIAGGGIAGLCLALNLHDKGISCCVYERAPDIKELGVGITLLPHAMREFAALGVDKKLHAQGIENLESCFFNRFGQLIYKEPRGKYAGYGQPEVGIHRGKLHLILYEAARAKFGNDAILLDHDATAPLVLLQRHPTLGLVSATCSYVPDYFALWGNAHTFSWEPFLERLIAPGQSLQWWIDYSF